MIGGGLKLQKYGIDRFPDLTLEEKDMIVEGISNRYSRQLLGLEFLWSNADERKNPSRDDWFGTNQHLEEIAKTLSEHKIPQLRT